MNAALYPPRSGFNMHLQAAYEYECTNSSTKLQSQAAYEYKPGMVLPDPAVSEDMARFARTEDFVAH